jgi:hypothetical protein
MEPYKKIKLIEDITNRLLLFGNIENPKTASQIARRWAK